MVSLRCLGAVSKVSWWCLGGALVVSRWYLGDAGGLLVVFRWLCLADIIPESCCDVPVVLLAFSRVVCWVNSLYIEICFFLVNHTKDTTVISYPLLPSPLSNCIVISYYCC